MRRAGGLVRGITSLPAAGRGEDVVDGSETFMNEFEKQQRIGLLVATVRTSAALLFKVSRRALGHPTKIATVAEARMAIAWAAFVAGKETGTMVRMADLAEPLGVNRTAVQKSCKRVEQLCDVDPDFKEKVMRLKAVALTAWNTNLKVAPAPAGSAGGEAVAA